MCHSCAVTATAVDELFVVALFSLNTHRFYQKSRVICSISDQNHCCLTLPYSAWPDPAAGAGQQGEEGQGGFSLSPSTDHEYSDHALC